MRFPLWIVGKVRERLNGKLLLYRLGSDDLAPSGTTSKILLRLQRSLSSLEWTLLMSLGACAEANLNS